MNFLWNLSQEGFGINTDVFDTNIINLSVVLVVVVYLGNDIFTALLETRSTRITQSLKLAEEKYQQAQAELKNAQDQLAESVTKAEEIRSLGQTTVLQASKALEQQAEAELQRLGEATNSSVRLALQRAMAQVQQQLVVGACEKALEKVMLQLDGNQAQKKMTQHQIHLFLEYDASVTR
jgi:F-type H+-transporting ATPase subunit b